MDLSKEDKKAIEEFHAYDVELSNLEAKVKALKVKMKPNKEAMATIVEKMEEHGSKLEIADDLILKIKKKSFDKTQPGSYATFFKTALTKVNAATQKVLLEVKEEQAKIVRVAAAYEVLEKESEAGNDALLKEDDSDLNDMKALAKESLERHTENIEELFDKSNETLDAFIEKAEELAS